MKHSLENVQNCTDITINHSKYLKTIETVRRAITPPYSSPFIVVFGAPKVGKTKLRRQLAQEVRAGVSLTDSTPVVEIELPLTPKNGIDTRDYHHKALFQLHDSYLAGVPDQWAQKDLFGQFEPLVRKFDHRDPKVLRRETLKRLEAEQCKLVLIDMRQTMINVAFHHPALTNQIRYIRDLALDSGIPHVLFGGYDLVCHDDLLSELAEGSKLIHFSRYVLQSEEEPFLDTLKEIESHLPAFEFSLANPENKMFMYAASLGCVGRIMDLAQDAIKSSLCYGRNKVSKETFEKHLDYPRVIKRLNEYIEYGEAKVTRSYEAWGEVYNSIVAGYHDLSDADQQLDNSEPTPKKSVKKRSKKKPEQFKVA